jgi:hypothetical protein
MYPCILDMIWSKNYLRVIHISYSTYISDYLLRNLQAIKFCSAYILREHVNMSTMKTHLIIFVTSSDDGDGVPTGSSNIGIG